MNLVFILVEPAVPQNIGACARAMNTMGFEQLRLVNPRCNHLDDESRWMAYGSEAVLEKVALYSTLELALNDVDFRVGTTARARTVRRDFVTILDVHDAIENRIAASGKCAIIFGSEEHGLTNAELALCDIVSTVPLKHKFPSLNLAQAVMVYSYELSHLEIRPNQATSDSMQYKALQKKVVRLLEELDIPKSQSLHRRIMERLPLASFDDQHLIHSICNKLFEAFHIGEK